MYIIYNIYFYIKEETLRVIYERKINEYLSSYFFFFFLVCLQLVRNFLEN